MRDRVFRAYAAGMIVCIAAYVLVPTDSKLPELWDVVGYLAVAGVVTGIRRQRPSTAATLWWCAAGLFLNVTGSVADYVFATDGYPTVGDGFYLQLYPAMAVGLIMLVRRRNGRADWAALTDAAVITTSLGLLAWIFVIQPAAADSSLSLLGRTVNLAYPIGDVVLIGIFVRLLLDGGRRTPAFWLILTSLAAFLGGDIGWAVYQQIGHDPGPIPQHVLDMLSQTAFVSFGAAALHPSVRSIGKRPPRGAGGTSRVLVATLTVAALLPSGLLAAELAQGPVVHGLALAAGATTVFLLVVVRLSQLRRSLENLTGELRDLALTDELTGLPNRRDFTPHLLYQLELAQGERRPLSVAMLDLDHFKRFNDAHGHLAGDRLLAAAAANWTAQLRDSDRLARYGGEEFIVLLDDTGADAAAAVLERLRHAVPEAQTVSIGVAEWDGQETSTELIARADRALYDAKAAGRDRVVRAPGRREPAVRPVATARGYARGGPLPRLEPA